MPELFMLTNNPWVALEIEIFHKRLAKSVTGSRETVNEIAL